MAPRNARLGIVVLPAAFAALTFLYIISIPYFSSIDEVHHFEFVRFLLREGRLPIVTEPGLRTAEFHQPPLYYALAAALGKAVLISPLGSLEGMSQATLVFYAARALSALFGLLTVAGTYLLARQLLPDSRGFAFGAAAIVAFTPTFGGLSSGVTNDISAAAFGSFFLFIVVAYFKRPSAWALLVLAGVLLGLGALTKENLLPLSLPFVGVIAFKSWQKRSVKHLVMALLLVYIPASAVSGWWYLRNWMHYGDPLAWNLQALLNPGIALRQPPSLAGYPQDFVGSVWQTFWIAFGKVAEVRADPAAYLGIATFLVLSLIGLARFILFERQRLAEPTLALSLAVPIGAIGLELIALLRFYQSFLGAAHGRFFYPVIAAVAVLIALGLYELLPRFRRVPLAGFVAFSGILALAGPIVYIGPLMARPEVVSLDQVRQEASPTDAIFAEGARLVGYSIENPRVSPGQELVVTLYWQGVADMDTDWTIYIHLLDARNKIYGQYDSIPLKERYPTIFWHRGEVWRETYQISIKGDTPGGLYHLGIGFYDLATGRHAVTSTQERSWEGGLFLGEVRVANPIPRPNPRNVVDIAFQDGVRLIGWDWDAGRVTLYWEATAQPSRSYTVFSHFLDLGGTLKAQHDGLPADGAMPTDLWEAGEFIIDEHPIVAPSGLYLLEVGAYSSATGQRLLLQQGGDSAILGQVESGVVGGG